MRRKEAKGKTEETQVRENDKNTKNKEKGK